MERGGKKGELARNQGAVGLIIHGQFSVPLTRLAALTHTEARCGQTWQVGELTGKLGVQEACSLSLSFSISMEKESFEHRIEDWLLYSPLSRPV